MTLGPNICRNLRSNIIRRTKHLSQSKKYRRNQLDEIYILAVSKRDLKPLGLFSKMCMRHWTRRYPLFLDLCFQGATMLKLFIRLYTICEVFYDYTVIYIYIYVFLEVFDMIIYDFCSFLYDYTSIYIYIGI